MEKIVSSYVLDTLESVSWLSKMLDKWVSNHSEYSYTTLIGPNCYIITVDKHAISKED